MNERVTRILNNLSILFLITSIIFMSDSVGAIDELIKDQFILIIMGGAFLLFYVSTLFSILHDLLLPLKKDKETPLVDEKTFLFFTICNFLFLLDLLFANANPLRQTILRDWLLNYLILLVCFLLISSLLLFILLIKSLKKGIIHVLDIKIAYLYLASFGLMVVGMLFFMRTIFVNNYDFLQWGIFLSLILANLMVMIYYQQKGDSVISYLMGSYRSKNEEEQMKLTKLQRMELIESHITTKVLIISTIANVVIVILFIYIIRLLLIDYRI